MKDGKTAESKRPKPYSVPKHYSKTALIQAIKSKRANTLIKDGVIDNKSTMGMAAPPVCPAGGGFGFGLSPTSAYAGAAKLLRGIKPPNPSGGR